MSVPDDIGNMTAFDDDANDNLINVANYRYDSTNDLVAKSTTTTTGRCTQCRSTSTYFYDCLNRLQAAVSTNSRALNGATTFYYDVVKNCVRSSVWSCFQGCASDNLR